MGDSYSRNVATERKMNNLLKDLEALKITGNLSDENLWQGYIELIEKSFVPQKTVGSERPCEEKDFREYRLIVDRNLRNIKCMLEHIIRTRDEEGVQVDWHMPMLRDCTIKLLVLIGEQHEKSIWNTAESVSISKELTEYVCNMYSCQSVFQFLAFADNFTNLILMLRPKLLKDTWKTYPGAVTCYKWIVKHADKPSLCEHINDVLPTALIIMDDFVPDNVIIGLECVYQILQHCEARKELVDTGYTDVIYHALERLSHQREARYVVPLYLSLATLLNIAECSDDKINVFEWTKRDDVLAILLDNMELEQNLELRHAYMLSVPQLLTHLGCAKWCERLTRILSEYCEHHTDLRTLKATLKTAKTYLLMFHLRVTKLSHCVALYSAFLKLHFDLTETPVFDKEIIQNLEDCICLLYKLTPGMGCAIMQNDRMRSVIRNNLQVACLGDTKYFE